MSSCVHSFQSPCSQPVSEFHTASESRSSGPPFAKMLPDCRTDILSPYEDVLLLHSLVSSILDGEDTRLFDLSAYDIGISHTGYKPASPRWTCSPERSNRLQAYRVSYNCHCYVHGPLRTDTLHSSQDCGLLSCTNSFQSFHYDPHGNIRFRQCKVPIQRMHYNMVIWHILRGLTIVDSLNDYISTWMPAFQLLDQLLCIHCTFLLTWPLLAIFLLLRFSIHIVNLLRLTILLSNPIIVVIFPLARI